MVGCLKLVGKPIMKNFWKQLCGFSNLAALLVAGFGFCLSGCAPLEPVNPPVTNRTTNAHPATGIGSDIINIGDAVIITFSDLPIVIPDYSERVKSDGSVTLLYTQKFQFAGKARGDLEAEIRERYVPAYFNNLTVNIRLAERFYFVDGNVRIPNRYPCAGETTVLKAIASAGGFNDFAKETEVTLTRASGQTVVVDAKAARANPALDLPVYPGDRVYVPRSIW